MSTSTDGGNVRGRARPRQLKLETVLLVTAGVAIVLSLVRNGPGLSAAAAVATLLIARAASPGLPRRRRRFLIAAGLAVAAEGYAAHLAYYTIDETISLCMFFLVGLNLLFVMMFEATPRLAYALVLLWAAVLVPPQILLEYDWYEIDREARSAIAYLEGYQARNGSFPGDLSGQPPRDSFLAREIRYRPDDQRGFVLSYRISSGRTTHVYSPGLGWHYDRR